MAREVTGLAMRRPMRVRAFISSLRWVFIYVACSGHLPATLGQDLTVADCNALALTGVVGRH
jgi:hypothetical protein